MKTTPTMPHAIAEAIESRLIDVHTAMVCKVQSYDATTQCAELVPQVKRPLESLSTGEIQHEDLPVLPNVKVSFPRQGNFFISFPVKAGEFVLVIFNEYSLDQWRSKGKATAPGDVGHLTMQGAMAIPLSPYPEAQALTQAHADNLVLGEQDGVQVHIKPGGTVEVTSGGAEDADDFVAQAGKVDTIISNIMSVFSGWTAVPNDGGAALKAAWSSVFGTPPASVASSNLKADD